MEQVGIVILAILIILAVMIDFAMFRRERMMAKRQRQAFRKWWNERENGPEGDH